LKALVSIKLTLALGIERGRPLLAAERTAVATRRNVWDSGKTLPFWKLISVLISRNVAGVSSGGTVLGGAYPPGVIATGAGNARQSPRKPSEFAVLRNGERKGGALGPIAGGRASRSLLKGDHIRALRVGLLASKARSSGCRCPGSRFDKNRWPFRSRWRPWWYHRDDDV